MRTTRVSSLSRRNSGPLRAVFLASLAATLAACSGGAPDANATAKASIPVEVASARHQSITANYSGTATLEAVGQASVVAKTTGIVLELPVEEGMYVRKGQLLLALDDDSARNKLAQASATLRNATRARSRASGVWA